MDRAIHPNNNSTMLLLSLLMIVGIGISGLYSASYGYAISIGKTASYFILRQLVWLAIATIIFIFISLINLDYFKKSMFLIVLFSIITLALTFVNGIGVNKNGAARWIAIGKYMFQPSELFKPVLILYLAYILSKKAERLNEIVYVVIPPFIVVVLAMFIILLQNDFSTALLIGIIAIVMFWIADVPLIFFIALATIGTPLVALSVLTSDYRLRRVLGFLAPHHDPSNLSYQVNGSLRAIQSGGLLGKGLGQGTLKLHSIPEVQSDFIFAAWAEETGFVGVIVFFALWSFFLFQSFRASFRTKDLFKSYLVFGSAAYLSMQILTNVMVTVGAIPATGIPLPFFSAGGSSIISASIAVGFIFNVFYSESTERKYAYEQYQ